MAIMMISEIEGQTAEGYERVLKIVEVALGNAEGLLMHSSHETPSGWQVIEVWESREHAGRFFAAHIAPHLPDGIRPKLRFESLHDVFVPAARVGA